MYDDTVYVSLFQKQFNRYQVNKDSTFAANLHPDYPRLLRFQERQAYARSCRVGGHVGSRSCPMMMGIHIIFFLLFYYYYLLYYIFIYAVLLLLFYYFIIYLSLLYYLLLFLVLVLIIVA